ncbi:sodium-coupled monocarboxylate transporter 2-like [Coccinella septempunctata]|uniref:sodium-coupled monocarboxylate transporter 2-like n=1 Tax=Coccinella septempunctata TaxID=41139 RepID=UPI001D06129A|nr:sodium-coupled monocarboxylate transporter 2-like [Coccinella septempunctata]
MGFQNLSTLVTTSLPTINLKTISFFWYDYLLFTVVLGFSSLIGIFFGCFRKQDTKKEYLLGGKRMNVWPIAISLVASHTSAITVLAIPADVYRYGLGFWQGCISLFLLHFTTSYIFLPVFYKLELTSIYEYLAMRFDEKTRMMASALYAVSLLLYLPIVIYIPSLGFATATGIGVHVVAPIACGICIFYTTIGGLKAVVWTDTFQFTLTVGCLVAVLMLALEKAGGFFTMWNTALEGHRLDVSFDPDPTRRDGFWAVVIGLTFMFTAQNSINQGCIQKFLALPSIADAKKSCFIYTQGCIIAKTLSILIGLTMYAIFAGCDPFTTKKVERNDQLVPYFIVDVGSSVPGLSGLFFAGVFCAALSTLSANLNCVAGTLYTDFISKVMDPKVSEKVASNILKLLVIIVGVCGCLMIYIIEHLGGIVQLSISLKGIADGPLLGVFAMGVLSRRINSKGAFYGALLSMLFMSWFFMMVKYYEKMGHLKYEAKPLSTANCTYIFNFNETSTISPPPSDDNIFYMFRLSFYYYTVIGTMMCCFIGSCISFFTNKKDDPIVPKKLLCPLVHWMYDDEEDEIEQVNKSNGDYFNVEQAIQLTTSHVEEAEKKS